MWKFAIDIQTNQQKYKILYKKQKKKAAYEKNCQLEWKNKNKKKETKKNGEKSQEMNKWPKEINSHIKNNHLEILLNYAWVQLE